MQTAGHRCDRLRSHGFRTSHRRNDARTRCCPPPDDFRSKSPEFREPRLSKNIDLVERLRKVGARHGRNPGEVAIAWVLSNPAVTGAIVGARNAKQAEGVMRAGELKLSAEEITEIEGGRRSRSSSLK